MVDLGAAQSLADAYMGGKRVVSVRPTEHPLEAALVFDDGTSRTVTGLFASKVLAVQNEPPVNEGSSG